MLNNMIGAGLARVQASAPASAADPRVATSVLPRPPPARVASFFGTIDAFLPSGGYARNDVGVGPSAALANCIDGVGTTLDGNPRLPVRGGTTWINAMQLRDHS